MQVAVDGRGQRLRAARDTRALTQRTDRERPFGIGDHPQFGLRLGVVEQHLGIADQRNAVDVLRTAVVLRLVERVLDHLVTRERKVFDVGDGRLAVPQEIAAAHSLLQAQVAPLHLLGEGFHGVVGGGGEGRAVLLEVGVDERADEAPAQSVRAGVEPPVLLAEDTGFPVGADGEDHLLRQRRLAVKQIAIGALLARGGVERAAAVVDHQLGGLGGLAVQLLGGYLKPREVVVTAVSRFEEADARLERGGGPARERRAAGRRGGLDVLVGEIEVGDQVADDHVAAVAVLVHHVVLVGLDVVGEPGNFAVSGQLVVVEPRTEPTGDAQVVVARLGFDGAVFRVVAAVDEVVHVLERAPAPAGRRLGVVGPQLDEGVGVADGPHVAHLVLHEAVLERRQGLVKRIGVEFETRFRSEDHRLVGFHLHVLRQVARRGERNAAHEQTPYIG